MEFALNLENRRIHATAADKSQEYFCPICRGRVTPRQGDINAWHFAHQSTCTDAWSYDMSEWHRTWQERFPEEQREVVIEHNGESHRADILTGNCVIEFQHSKISASEFEERNAFYTSAGYKVIWVFDEIEACQTGQIIDSDDDLDKYIWKWPNRSISSVVPQHSSNVAIILQLAEADDETNDLLLKVEWAILEYGTFANYKRFIVDNGFEPDLFSVKGLRDIFLNKKQRFEIFLYKNQPFQCKCGRVKGNPRDWYLCPRTGNWHDGECKKCQHNLINEYRKSTAYQKGGLFSYCCYPRKVVNSVDEIHGGYNVPSIRT